MTDLVLIQHCVPTLAGLKTGNLFAFRFPERTAMMQAVRRYNTRLANRGIIMIPLRFRNGSGLLYVYRPELLKRDLSGRGARDLLRDCGYHSNDCARCIREIIRRLRYESEFPHEIGLFLSYPPEDVRGFIEQRAGNCKACGLWKVYGDVEDAQSIFTKFARCTKQYQRAWQNGIELEKLAVKLEKENGS